MADAKVKGEKTDKRMIFMLGAKKQVIVAWAVLGLFILVSSGCSVLNNGTTTDQLSDKFVYCKAPRPQMCTLEYVPVCAKLTDGSQKTYSNGCQACSDNNVVKYLPDSCPE